MQLDDRLASHMPRWEGEARAGVTIRDLLAHCSGLPAYRDIYARERDEAGFTAVIADLPLAYAPRSRSLYSDLDFMLLGFALGGSTPLSGRARAIFAQMGIVDHWSSGWQASRRDGPRQRDTASGAGGCSPARWNDENAWALGGTAGHAGLFGTALPSDSRATSAADSRRRAEWSRGGRSRSSWRGEPTSRQLTGPRMGHHAADLVLRHSHVAARLRPYRLHRHVAVDRSG
jgi:CubicO group peptidase (beta-lactamase class C family)